MKAKTITIAPMFAIITAICSQFIIVLPFTPVPINLGNFAVFLSGGLLNKKDSLISQLIYISLGIIGLPVFSKFGSGFGVLLGPTGGYILSYVIMAFVISFIIEKLSENLINILLAMLVGLLICYTLGTIGFMLYSGCGLYEAIISTILPFIIFDIIKLVVAGVVSLKLKKVLN